jgi:hypothetical protein
MTRRITLEVCVDAAAGAGRIELCAALEGLA